jgi:hypothetical protein
VESETRALREESDAARRRHRRVRGTTVAIGAAVGIAAGIAVLFAIDETRISGDDASPFVLLLGLPVFTMIAGAVLGGLLGGVEEHGIPDAPVRSPRFAREGRAATSEHGQLPGSAVEPRIRDDPAEAAAEPPLERRNSAP